jgi:catechol 2,3-dioxygenase-like lactoylglutathione lyase family enzyme
MAAVLTHAAPTVFIPTADAGRARRFYEETLGLDFVADEDFALVFRLAGGVTLRVTRVENPDPRPFTVLGWRVPDVAEALSDLEQKGVRCERFPGLAQDARGVWQSPSGTRVAWFKDPDGNLLSVSQHPEP